MNPALVKGLGRTLGDGAIHIPPRAAPWFEPDVAGRWGGWQLVNELGGGFYPDGGVSSPTLNFSNTGLTRTSRRRCVAHVAISALKLEYENSCLDTKPTTAADHDAVTVKAGIEYDGAFTAVTFDGGSSSKSMAVDTRALSDTVTVSIPAGAEFWVRTHYVCATGKRAPLNALSMQSDGEGLDTSGSDKSVSGTISASNNKMWVPTAVLAQTNTPLANPLFIGDSVTVGVGEASGQSTLDRARGWVGRAFQGIPHYRMALGGEQAQNFPTTFTVREAIPDTGAHAYAFVCMGINDIQDGSRTGAQVLTDLDDIYDWLKNDCGIPRIVGVTIPPFSVTGTYTSAGGQTVNSTQNTHRNTVNAAIRNLDSALLHGYFDLAALVEDGSTGKWNSAGGTARTTDGTHPNAQGNADIATGIEPADYGVRR